MKEFFSHEVQSFPPALSEFGNLRLPSAKSDLLKCLQPNSNGHTDSPTQFDCKVLDGAVIVHCLPKVEASTFDDYAEKVFIPHLQQQLHQSKRVNFVWDSYVPDSLKEATREERGQGIRRKEHLSFPMDLIVLWVSATMKRRTPASSSMYAKLWRGVQNLSLSGQLTQKLS
ncbi:hypothetical protein ACROYT_G042179 [Oculina patagonica]